MPQARRTFNAQSMHVCPFRMYVVLGWLAAARRGRRWSSGAGARRGRALGSENHETLDTENKKRCNIGSVIQGRDV